MHESVSCRQSESPTDSACVVCVRACVSAHLSLSLCIPFDSAFMEDTFFR